MSSNTTVSSDEVLLSCSFVRPIRTSIGETVNIDGWAHGPAPFIEDFPLISGIPEGEPNPFFIQPGDTKSRARTEEKRKRYFQNRMQSLLYPEESGPRDSVTGVRRHSAEIFRLKPYQWGDGIKGDQPYPPITVIGREYLSITIPDVLPEDQPTLTYVVVHLLASVPPGADAFAVLANALSTVHATDRMAEIGIDLVKTPGQNAPVRSSVHVVTPNGQQDHERLLAEHAQACDMQMALNDILQRWAPEALLASLFAGRQTLAGKAPDPEDDRIKKGVVHLSYDWRAHVGRNGFTFVSLSPKDMPHAFHRKGRSLAHSMYLDALLLGQIQREAANHMADTVVDVHLQSLDTRRAQEAERHMLAFRSQVWWSQVTEQAENVDALLSRFQRQHQLPELVEQVNQDLTDVARFQSLQQESRTNRAIALLTALFVLPTLILGAAAIYATDYTWGVLGFSLGLSAIAAAVGYFAWGRWMRRGSS